MDNRNFFLTVPESEIQALAGSVSGEELPPGSWMTWLSCHCNLTFLKGLASSLGSPC